MSHNSEEATLATILRRIDHLVAVVETLTPSKTPKLLSLAEAAKARGVSIDTIRRACDCKELRYIQARPGAAKRIATEDLQKWIDRHAVAPRRTR